MLTAGDNRITEQQLELLKSFKHLRTEQDIQEVRELLSLYFERKLDAAIDKAENERKYTQEVYESWLAQQRRQSA